MDGGQMRTLAWAVSANSPHMMTSRLCMAQILSSNYDPNRRQHVMAEHRGLLKYRCKQKTLFDQEKSDL
jgi:hypothetical protein